LQTPVNNIPDVPSLSVIDIL